MIVLLNGAFGIGKTTVARALRRRLPGSVIFDPEHVGFVLQRMPTWIPLEGRGTDDFQDLALWRRASILGIRTLRAMRETVIVPMAFSDLGVLDQFLRGAARFDPAVRHLCLVAPLAVVLGRLAKRAEDSGPPATAWQRRRARECCDVHQRPEFSEQVSAEHGSPEEIAAEIADRVSRPRPA